MIPPEDCAAIQESLELNKYPQNSGENLCPCYFLEDWPIADDEDYFCAHAQILAYKWRLADGFGKSGRKGAPICILD